MDTKNEGWIEHDGSECPVDSKACVEVRNARGWLIQAEAWVLTWKNVKSYRVVSAPPTTRPASYDQKLVDYLPFFRRCANRLAYNDDADEIVQDAYVDGLNRWHMYDAENYKFGTWVFQLVRCAASNRRVKARAKKRAGVSVQIEDMVGHPSTLPNQLDYAELSAVLRRLSGTRDSDALMRVAMGEELDDVGAGYGVSKQRVFQLCQRERARLVAA